MKRTWNERLMEAGGDGKGGAALLPFLQEPFPTFLLGASLISGFLWNHEELGRLLDAEGKLGIPANLSYGSFLNTFARLENDKFLGGIFYHLLFYGLIDPLSKLDQETQPPIQAKPSQESEGQ